MLLISASQVTLYRECARKWAWKHIAKIETPQHPAAALGDEVEKGQLVPYLRDGRPFDFTKPSGYIANSGLEYLPEPKTPGLQFQHKFVIPSPTWSTGPGGEREHIGFGYIGYKDFTHADSKILPNIPSFEGGAVPLVGDFKTTSNVKEYAKTEETLRTDVQANLYAFDAMYQTGSRVIDLVWITMQTGEVRRAVRAHYRAHASDVAEQFVRINETATEIHQIRKKSQAPSAPGAAAYPLTLPKNLSMCEEFKGCPYIEHCQLSATERAEAHALAEEKRRQWRLRKEKKTVSNTPNATIALLAGLRNRQPSGAAPPVAPTAPTAPASPELAQHIAENPRAAFLVAGIPALPINPPESALPPAPPVGVTPTAPVGVTPTSPVNTAPAEETKRGPGRPKGSKNVPKEPPKEAPPPDAAPVVPTPAAASTPAKPISTLYIDCYPVGASVVQAESFFDVVRMRVQEKHGVPDYRLIDFKGAGIFAATLGDVVDVMPVGDVVLDTRTPEGALAKSVLVFRAAHVVQGLR